MATVSFIPESHQSISAMKAVIEYCLQQKKVADTDSGRRWVGGVNCNGENAFTEFMVTKTLIKRPAALPFISTCNPFHRKKMLLPSRFTKSVWRLQKKRGRDMRYW